MQYTINLCVNLSRIDYYMLAGGSTGNTELSSVYYLADGGSDWVTIQPMTVPRKYPACALVGDHLYVVGGTGKSSVEVLDTLTLTWQTGYSLTDCNGVNANTLKLPENKIVFFHSFPSLVLKLNDL